MKYKIYQGKSLTQEMYLKTWELDNVTFEDKDKLTKDKALEWFEYSNRSTIVLWNEKDNSIVGYITPYVVNDKFSQNYILSNKDYHTALNKSAFYKVGEKKEVDIYLFSVVVIESYRDKKITDTKDKKFYNKSAIKVLTEAFLDYCCELKEDDLSINYIFAEAVSKDGEKYLSSLGMRPCFNMSNDVKYAKLFSADIFKKCSNSKKIYDVYKNNSARVQFNKELLKNHEYLSIKNNCICFF